MAVSGGFAGRLAEVEVGTDGVTYNGIERVNNPRISGSNDKAETSSNDSGGNKEYIYTWGDMTLTFEMVADEAATQQELLWTAFGAKTILYWRGRPRGVVSGNKQIYFQGLIMSIEQNSDKGDKSTYTVTVQRTGSHTRDAQ